MYKASGPTLQTVGDQSICHTVSQTQKSTHLLVCTCCLHIMTSFSLRVPDIAVFHDLQIWQLPDLVLVNTLRGHKRGVWAAQFSPVDQAVATASGDKTLRLWALADGTCLKTFEGHTASVLRLNFLSAGTQARSYHPFAERWFHPFAEQSSSKQAAWCMTIPCIPSASACTTNHA